MLDMFIPNEFSAISNLEGTTIITIKRDRQEAIDMLAKRPPLLLKEPAYTARRQQEGIIGHPDVFYKISPSRKPKSKFDYEYTAGVTPVVLNESFFIRGNEDYSDLAPFILLRANAEIGEYMKNIMGIFYDADAFSTEIEQGQIDAWVVALSAAEKEGKLDRLTSFYNSALHVQGEPLSADDSDIQIELGLMNRALENINPKPIKPRPVKKFFSFLPKK